MSDFVLSGRARRRDRPGLVQRAYLEQTAGGTWIATNSAPAEHPYTYQLSHPCVVDDRNNRACRASDFRECPAATGSGGRGPGHRTAPPGHHRHDDPTGTATTTIDGFDAFDLTPQ